MMNLTINDRSLKEMMQGVVAKVFFKVFKDIKEEVYEEKIYTQKEAANFLKIGVKTLKTCTEKGWVKRFYIGDSTIIRYRRSDLIQSLKTKEDYFRKRA